jgi:LacI family transcriptional regulator
VPTLKDVAAEAGVALGTVSRVINREPSVSPELVARVERAIQTLDYRPNVLGRNLRRRRSGTIGVVVPDITALFFAELIKHVEKAAMEVGYSVLIGNSANSRKIEDLYLSKLSDGGLDGMVFSSSADDDAPVIREGAALVAVDREVSGFDFIASDHETGAREVVRHLADLGHRRIACISGPATMPVFQQRLAGYRSVVETGLKELGISPETYTRFEPLDSMRGIDAAHSLLELPDRPTAVFATTDQQAIGALRACGDRGLRVPEEISVVGFDDIPLADLVNPRLTTVRQPIEQIGRLAVERLLLRMGLTDEPAQRWLLDTELRHRESSAPPATG